MEYRFSLSGSREMVEKNMKRLTELLGFSGTSFSIIESNNTQMLCIDIDEKKINKSRTRNAGRKPKQVENFYTYAEIKEMKTKMNAADIAKFLGISRATYFRILKEFSDNGYDDNMPFMR